MSNELIRAVIVAGVSGSGKTTVGNVLAASLDWEFRDADELHPGSNVDKMSRGIPLTDSDREPWLKRVRSDIDHVVQHKKGVVMACSALRQEYAGFLTQGRPYLRLAVLKVCREVLMERLAGRKSHFFPPELLDSQLETQELPDPDLIFDGSRPPREIAAEIARRFGLD